MSATKSPVLFIPHGGGPLPLLNDPGHQSLVDFLQGIRKKIPEPSAIVIISAHWEAEPVAITCTEKNHLVYDYYGFPEATYHIQYPAPGAVDLAHRIHQLLHQKQINSFLDTQRGLDHGVFIPLKIIYPEARIPCLQISLSSQLDPLQHIQLGQALTELRNENILIIGSGFSFHNLPALMSATDDNDIRNESFENWLIDTCTRKNIPEAEREQKLIHWEQAPHARYCHPREEHLLPLHVCYGMAQSPASLVFDGRVAGKKTCAFLW